MAFIVDKCITESNDTGIVTLYDPTIGFCRFEISMGFSTESMSVQLLDENLPDEPTIKNSFPFKLPEVPEKDDNRISLSFTFLKKLKGTVLTTSYLKRVKDVMDNGT